jgi:quercetin dioxygenase-like cupin family protein
VGEAVQLSFIPWSASSDSAAPAERALRIALEREGFEVHAWRDPAGRLYAPHAHARDESLWVLWGSIVLEVDGRAYPLGPGDRLLLPAGVVHRAEAGPEGARYLIGERRTRVQQS